MPTTIVTTQTELDAALASAGADSVIEVRSPAGVWLTVSNTGSATVRASGSATVWASGSATVRASDSATVRASDTATVWASDTATVRASGSATVQAYDTATVQAYDTATVEAYDAATVRAYDTATVRASDTATVQAYGTATVRAYDAATVWAAKYVAVHLHSTSVTLHGGVVIDMTDVDPTRTADWLDLTGAIIKDGKITVYKAVNDNLESGRGLAYPIGQTITDAQWTDNHECGGGLHFSPTPRQARDYFASATRYLACEVDADQVRCIDATKLKAPTCVVLHEVDINGNPTTKDN